YKRHPRTLLVRAPWERTAPRTGARCVFQTQWNIDLVTSLLTTCEICE
ncbi:unnamed protein product, partial [Staurois parvus]